MRMIPVSSILILVLIVLPLGADQLPVADPGSVGMSQERLEKIDVLAQKDIQRGELAGAVTLIARKGKVVHFKAHGFADLESRRPMKTDTVFRLASMTKPIASVALMMLYEEGRFNLRDPISSYLPEFKSPVVMEPDQSLSGGFKMVQASREINFRDILTHTAGLPRSRGTLPNTQLYVEKVEPLRTSGATLEEVIKAYASRPLAYHPGTQWS